MNKFEGHYELCYYCGERCNGLAGNPSLWPVLLCHDDDPGKVKWHHIGCVSSRLHKLQKIEEATATLTIDLQYIKTILGN